MQSNMKFRILIPCLTVGLILAACQPGPAQDNKAAAAETKAAGPVKQVLAPQLFQEKLAAMTGAQIIDVRTPAEYAQSHLQGAKNIDVKNQSFTTQIESLDKTRPVYLYCQSGIRSANAASILSQSGFQEIYDMQGGMRRWQAEGRKTEK